MEIINMVKYKDINGIIWGLKKECQRADDEIEIKKNFPIEVIEIRDCLVKLFGIETTMFSNIEDFFKIDILSEEYKTQFKILMKFECANQNYTKAIGELLSLLSQLPKSAVSFDQFSNDTCTLHIDINYEEDLIFLREAIAEKK